MAKTLDDAIDFIGNVRNVLMTQFLTIENMKDTVQLHNIGDLAQPCMKASDDPDVKPVERTSLMQDVDGIENLNRELFDLVGQLQNFFDNYPKDIKDAISAVNKMNGSTSTQTPC